MQGGCDDCCWKGIPGFRGLRIRTDGSRAQYDSFHVPARIILTAVFLLGWTRLSSLALEFHLGISGLSLYHREPSAWLQRRVYGNIMFIEFVPLLLLLFSASVDVRELRSGEAREWALRPQAGRKGFPLLVCEIVSQRREMKREGRTGKCARWTSGEVKNPHDCRSFLSDRSCTNPGDEGDDPATERGGNGKYGDSPPPNECRQDDMNSFRTIIVPSWPLKKESWLSNEWSIYIRIIEIGTSIFFFRLGIARLFGNKGTPDLKARAVRSNHEPR